MLFEDKKWHASMSREIRRGFLSLGILWILKRKRGSPMYGYEIIRTFERMTDGGWVPKAGTIYPILRRLERKGLVRSEWVSSKSAGPRRRYYSITPEGKEAIRRIFMEWRRTMSGFRDFLVELLGVD